MRVWGCWVLMVGALASSAAAAEGELASQEITKAAKATEYTELPPTTSMSAETWVYLQEYRKAQDPETLIFRRAQDRAENRRRRLEALAWFGYSNARPTVNPVPATSGSYSAFWAGNHVDPYRWSGVSAATIVIQR